MDFPCTITNIQEKQEDTSPKTPPPPSSPSSYHQHEHMFEKVVTPSDVGKLNRLVIPKQHAERYFPLDPASNNNVVLLLNFEEEGTGRSWRFRYSYWNSSQSYVMTKGWSRFVKDKSLDPGDVVSFSRGQDGRLFIDWRRRLVPPVAPTWGRRSLMPTPLYRSHTPLNQNSEVKVRVDHGILESLPVVVVDRSSIEPRRQVRLFGVNLECSKEEEEPPSPLQWGLSAARQSGS